MHKSMKKYFAIFVLPTLLAFIISFVIPFIMGIVLSFGKFRTIRFDKISWVGFDNYKQIFSDTSFLYSLKITSIFSLISVVVINALAFFLALLLTKKMKGTNIFRTIFFMPNLIGGIILGYIWKVILNGFLELFCHSTLAADYRYGFIGLIILIVWQLTGYMMIIYIAGIQNIPSELNEAAKIDGASKGQILRKITIPMIMPSITICLFLTISNSFKMFDQNLALTGGGPIQVSNGVSLKQTSLLALDIFDTYNKTGMYKGIAQSKAVIFFLLVMIISFVQLLITRKREVTS